MKNRIFLVLLYKVIFDLEQSIFMDFEGCEGMCACVLGVFRVLWGL